LPTQVAIALTVDLGDCGYLPGPYADLNRRMCLYKALSFLDATAVTYPACPANGSPTGLPVARSHIRTVLSTPPETTTGRPSSSATAPPRVSPTGEAADCELGLALRLFDTGLSPQLRAALPRIDPADVTAVGARSSARLSSLRTGMRQRWPACRGDWNCPAGTSILARAHPMRRSGRPPRSPA